jgi:uncharacterized OsmC-like protein
MTMTTAVKNGVDVQKLGMFIEEVKREPWKARLTFTVKSEWKGGFRAVHTASDYIVGNETAAHASPQSIASDEPPEILGSDAGISPAELLLSALASCLSVGYAANAAGMGIDLKQLRFEITGHGDLQGFMNLNGVRPGITEIEVKTFLEADAPRAQLEELHEIVNSRSPIWDTLKNPVDVRSELVVLS